MSIIVSGNFEIECMICKNQHVFNPSDCDFQEVSREMREMGDEIEYLWQYEVDCRCESKIEFEYSIWEYPVGVYNTDHIEINGGEVIQKFDIAFENI